MYSACSFTFCIPLMPRAAARDWQLVEALLGLTLASVRAQTDRNFRVIIAGHDRPRCIPADDRFMFLKSDWPAEAPDSRNCDAGRKKYALKEAVLQEGGGLLMYLDADDWIDARLVETARRAIGPEHVGGIVDTGFAIDFRNLTVTPLPHPRVFAGGFHRLCGSSVVARMRPQDSDAFRRDPWSMIVSHHEWIEAARAQEAAVARLPVAGGYLINTSENHSELYGPYAEWRRGIRRSRGSGGPAARHRSGAPLRPAAGRDPAHIGALPRQVFGASVPTVLGSRAEPFRRRLTAAGRYPAAGLLLVAAHLYLGARGGRPALRAAAGNQESEH
jgi:hypothetical protein